MVKKMSIAEMNIVKLFKTGHATESGQTLF